MAKKRNRISVPDALAAPPDEAAGYEDLAPDPVGEPDTPEPVDDAEGEAEVGPTEAMPHDPVDEPEGSGIAGDAEDEAEIGPPEALPRAVAAAADTKRASLPCVDELPSKCPHCKRALVADCRVNHTQKRPNMPAHFGAMLARGVIFRWRTCSACARNFVSRSPLTLPDGM